jgi:hypothetical protein
VNVGTKQDAVDRSSPALFEAPKGPTPEQIKGKWLKERHARGATVIDAVTGQPAAEVATTEAVAEAIEASGESETETSLSDGETSEGGDAPLEAADSDLEKSRLQRIEEATRRAKAASRARRTRDAELAQARADNARLRQETSQATSAASRVQMVEQALRDPSQAMNLMKQLGMTPEQLVQHALREGTPEARMEAEANERKALQAELKAIKDAMQAEKQNADFAQKKAEYLKRAGNTDKYPNLAGHPGDALIQLGLDIAQKLKAKYPVEAVTDHAILYNLNRMYAKAAPKTEPAVSSTKASAATTKAASKSTGTSKPKPASPQTLTNAQAAGSFAKSADWDKLSRTERISRLREGYRR